MSLIELEKQIEKNKVISAFKDGVVDGLIHGIRDTKYQSISHHYYKEGYDFGITLYCRQIDEEEKIK